jgi:putative membrane protein
MRSIHKNAITGVAMILAANPVLASIDGARQNQGMWGDGYGMGYMGHGMGVILWIVVIVLIVFAVKWFSDRNGPKHSPKTGIDVLKERYAKGEIDKPEFGEKRDVLQS